MLYLVTIKNGYYSFSMHDYYNTKSILFIIYYNKLYLSKLKCVHK